MSDILIKKNNKLGQGYNASEYLRRSGSKLLTDVVCNTFHMTTRERREKLSQGSLLEITQTDQYNALRDALSEGRTIELLNILSVEDRRQHPRFSRVINQSMFSTLPRLEDLNLIDYNCFNDLFLMSFILDERMGIIKTFEKYYFSDKKSRLSKLALIPKLDCEVLLDVHLESYLDSLVADVIDTEVRRLKEGLNGGIKEGVTTLLKIPIQQLEDSFRNIIQNINYKVIEFMNLIPLLSEAMVAKTVDQYNLWPYVDLKPEQLVTYKKVAGIMPDMPLNYSMPFLMEKVIIPCGNSFSLSEKSVKLAIKPQAFFNNEEFIQRFFSSVFKDQWLVQDASKPVFSEINLGIQDLFPDVKYREYYTERKDPITDTLLYHYVSFDVTPKIQSCLALSQKTDQKNLIRNELSGDASAGQAGPWTLFVKSMETFINSDLDIYSRFNAIADIVIDHAPLITGILYGLDKTDLKTVILHSCEEITPDMAAKPVSRLFLPRVNNKYNRTMTYNDILNFSSNVIEACQNGTIANLLDLFDAGDREEFLYTMRDMIATSCLLRDAIDDVKSDTAKEFIKEAIESKPLKIRPLQISDNTVDINIQDKVTSEEDGLSAFDTLFGSEDSINQLTADEKKVIEKYTNDVDRMTEKMERIILKNQKPGSIHINSECESYIEIYNDLHYKTGITPDPRFIQPKFLMNAYDGLYSQTASDFDPITLRAFNEISFSLAHGFYFKLTLPFMIDSNVISRYTDRGVSVPADCFSLQGQVATDTGVHYTYFVDAKYLDSIRRLIAVHYNLADGNNNMYDQPPLFNDANTFKLDIDLGLEDNDGVWAKSLMDDKDVLNTKMNDLQVAIMYALNRQQLTSWNSLSDTCKLLLTEDINFQVSPLGKNSFNVLRNLDVIVDLTRSLRISDLHYMDQKFIKAQFVIQLTRTLIQLFQKGIAYLPFSSDVIMFVKADDLDKVLSIGLDDKGEMRDSVQLTEYMTLLADPSSYSSAIKGPMYNLTNVLADMFEDVYKCVSDQLDLLAFSPKHLVHVKKRDFYLHAFTMLIDMFINMAVGDSIFSDPMLRKHSAKQVIMSGIQKNNVKLLEVDSSAISKLLAVLSSPQRDVKTVRTLINEVMRTGTEVQPVSDAEAGVIIEKRFPLLSDIVSVLSTKASLFTPKK